MRPKRASALRSAIYLNPIGLIFMQAHNFGCSTNMEMTVLIKSAFFLFDQILLSLLLSSSWIDQKALACSSERLPYISGQLKSLVFSAIYSRLKSSQPEGTGLQPDPSTI